MNYKCTRSKWWKNDKQNDNKDTLVCFLMKYQFYQNNFLFMKNRVILRKTYSLKWSVWKDQYFSRETNHQSRLSQLDGHVSNDLIW